MEKIEEIKKRRLIYFITDWIAFFSKMLILCIFLVLCVRPSFVLGSSMLYTLHDGDVLLTEKLSFFSRDPIRGEIIVTKPVGYDKKMIVKRIIGLPNDHIVIRNGEFFLNDELQQEDYIKDPETSGDVDIIVEPGHYFIMGDNRLHSNDSRFEIGSITKDQIAGRPYFRIFPFNNISKIN